MTRLFIGNLSYKLDEPGLVAALASLGIQAQRPHIARDRATKQPRGFGFVEVEDGEAEAAIVAGDGAELFGRTIRVARAQPSPHRGGADGKGVGGGARRTAPPVEVAPAPGGRRSRTRSRDDDLDDVWR